MEREFTAEQCWQDCRALFDELASCPQMEACCECITVDDCSYSPDYQASVLKRVLQRHHGSVRAVDRRRRLFAVHSCQISDISILKQLNDCVVASCSAQCDPSSETTGS